MNQYDMIMVFHNVKIKTYSNVFIFFLFSFPFFFLTNLANSINPLPDDKILEWSKLKQIADYI